MNYDDDNVFAKILRGEILEKFMRTNLYYHFMILIHKKNTRSYYSKRKI